MNSFYRGFILLVLCSNTYVLADSARCYSCSGMGCNDPFNVTSTNIMNCSVATTYRAAGRNIDLQVEDTIFSSLNGYRATTNEYVCTKFVYESDSTRQVATVRRCVAKTIDNASACETIIKTVSVTLGKVQTCSTCDSDLCNSGVSLMQSFAISFILVCFLKILE